ncbi:ABC transporter permease [Caloramator proteoclasticus]|uniref:Tungstate transport system permease protein n=1 Tax=Caloramator proteoclasticus DSM 10124 TaxID=1121262 RepID=A0A1M4TQG9_9CLOT|nr:ABC transporter permease [Caloramator proteoclasticus]SHE46693.1 tungstate transport system permease protein [Caloramator proteoclasticus DSM 10124]
MRSIWQGTVGAFNLILGFDRNIIEIVLLSLYVSFMSTIISSVIGIFLSLFITIEDFKFNKGLKGIINTFMAIPPVVAGLLVYILFSKRGPLGSLGLLFTPTVMIIAQIIIIVPLIAGTAINIVNTKGSIILEELNNLNADKISRYILLFRELKFNIIATVFLGFSRAVSEVGAVMLVGGNIEHKTRVMTTYIVLQTNMGNFEEAIAVGIILLCISFLVNLLISNLNRES